MQQHVKLMTHALPEIALLVGAAAVGVLLAQLLFKERDQESLTLDYLSSIILLSAALISNVAVFFTLVFSHQSSLPTAAPPVEPPTFPATKAPREGEAAAPPAEPTEPPFAASKPPTQHSHPTNPTPAPGETGNELGGLSGGVTGGPPPKGWSLHKYIEFEWPPPEPSARLVIPERFFSNSSTLGEVAHRLEVALSQTGYLERSYFLVPGGIAIVTRVERIYPDGHPFPEPHRWYSKNHDHEWMPLSRYLKSLVGADEGYYRFVVFVLTDQAFGSKARSINVDEAVSWLSSGLNTLPVELANLHLSKYHECTALIYEFIKPQGNSPSLLQPSEIGAQQHLAASGLYALLAGQ